MFALLALVFMADPTFVVENKCPVVFVVENKIPSGAATSTRPSFPAPAVQHAASRPDGTSSGEAAPTPYAEVVRVIGLLPVPQIGFVDFGCGDGRWLLAAAERWPGVRVTGVELDEWRASATRERVRLAGLSNRIEVITGDCLTTPVVADVATMYLWPSVIEQLRPRLGKMKAVASYQHPIPGLSTTKNGDTFLYVRPAPTQTALVHPTTAVWNGREYSGPVCNSSSCPMCNAIRAALAATVAVQVPKVEPPKAVPTKAVSGHYVRMCDGRRCWLQWVSD